MIYLTPHEQQQIQEILKKYPQIESARIFGSRVLGTHKKGSDIDIAISGNLDITILNNIRSDFEESLLPYFVDVLDLNTITNTDLIEHINTHGEELLSVDNSK